MTSSYWGNGIRTPVIPGFTTCHVDVVTQGKRLHVSGILTTVDEHEQWIQPA